MRDSHVQPVMKITLLECSFLPAAEQRGFKLGGQMRKAYLFLAVLAISTASSAQSNARPEILVLGTYHMANPGHDIYNMHVDDVQSPKRRQEIAQVIEVLKK